MEPLHRVLAPGAPLAAARRMAEAMAVEHVAEALRRPVVHPVDQQEAMDLRALLRITISPVLPVRVEVMVQPPEAPAEMAASALAAEAAAQEARPEAPAVVEATAIASSSRYDRRKMRFRGMTAGNFRMQTMSGAIFSASAEL